VLWGVAYGEGMREDVDRERFCFENSDVAPFNVL